MRCDVRDIQQMVVMSVTDKDHQGAVSRSWKQPLYYPRIGRDSRTTLQPLKSVGPSTG